MWGSSLRYIRPWLRICYFKWKKQQPNITSLHVQHGLVLDIWWGRQENEEQTLKENQTHSWRKAWLRRSACTLMERQQLVWPWTMCCSESREWLRCRGGSPWAAVSGCKHQGARSCSGLLCAHWSMVGKCLYTLLTFTLSLERGFDSFPWVGALVVACVNNMHSFRISYAPYIFM